MYSQEIVNLLEFLKDVILFKVSKEGRVVELLPEDNFLGYDCLDLEHHLVREHLCPASGKSVPECGDMVVLTAGNEEKKHCRISFDGVEGKLQDITELVALKTTTRNLELFRTSFVHTAPMSIMIFDKAGTTVYVNPFYLKDWGLPGPEYIVGKYNILKCSEIKAKGMMPFVVKAFQGQVVETPEINYEIVKEKSFNEFYPDGSKFNVKPSKWVKSKLFPIFDRNNEVEFVVLTHNDVTEQRELQKKIVQTEKFNSLGTLVSGIAHEFNNTLCAINTYSQLLRRSKTLNPEFLKDALNVIETQTRHAMNIVHRLQVYSPNAHARSITNICVLDAVDATLKLLNLRIQSNRISIHKSMDPQLSITFDHTEFHELLMNLIKNAIDAIEMKAVEQESFIDISAIAIDDMVHLRIEDNGIGIEPGSLNNVFDPFFTSKQSRSGGQVTGTGLGLSMCYSIVHDYGGKISVESSTDPGNTVFKLELPLNTGFVFKSKEVPEYFTEYENLKARILVIEDEEYIASGMRYALELKEFRVDLAFSGQDGIRMIQENEYQLVFCDYFLPDMNGNEIVKKIKTLRTVSCPRIIIVTGNVNDIPETLYASIFATIQKPFDLNELYHFCYFALKESLMDAGSGQEGLN